MITLVTGTPGSGKSLKAAYDIIFDLKHGHNVITNFDIEPKKYFKNKKTARFTVYADDEMTVSNLIKYARKYHQLGKEHQTTIYMDEPDIFNPRQSLSASRPKWVKFLRLHRKLGYDIVIITQSDILIDKQIRKFIEIEQRCYSFKHYKNLGFIISIFFGGNLFFCKERWYDLKIGISTTYYRLNKRKARIYDTFNTFGSFDYLIDEL